MGNVGEMDKFDYWRLCDDLSIKQAALLVVGVDPSEYSHVENWEMETRPVGYDAAKTAIVNGLKRGDIEGAIAKEPELDQNGAYIGESIYIDIGTSTVSVGSLRVFLSRRGISTGFFFPDGFDDRSYLDPGNACYAPKLAAAVMAWESVSSDEALLNGKTPKQAIEKWLREHATEYGLTGDDGNPVGGAIDQIAKVTNWKPGGGAAKTPTPPQVKDNHTPPEKDKENQIDDLDLDSEIPF